MGRQYNLQKESKRRKLTVVIDEDAEFVITNSRSGDQNWMPSKDKDWEFEQPIKWLQLPWEEAWLLMSRISWASLCRHLKSYYGKFCYTVLEEVEEQSWRQEKAKYWYDLYETGP